MLSHSSNKREDAFRLGADDFIATRDKSVFKKNVGHFDFIFDTGSAQHDYNAYLNLLRHDGTMVLLGLADHPSPLAAAALIFKRLRLAGSLIGGTRKTRKCSIFVPSVVLR